MWKIINTRVCKFGEHVLSYFPFYAYIVLCFILIRVAFVAENKRVVYEMIFDDGTKMTVKNCYSAYGSVVCGDTVYNPKEYKIIYEK